MAVEKGNSIAMFNLGNFYYQQDSYDNMKKYLLMAIENGNYDAMTELISYYRQNERYVEIAKLIRAYSYKFEIIGDTIKQQGNELKKVCDDAIKIFNILRRYIGIDDIAFIINDYF